jgi:hypothetical protein
MSTAAEPVLTSVIVVDQEPADARCTIEPAALYPAMEAAASSIVYVTPPMMMVPVRAAPVFAAVWNVTVPLLLPDAEPVMVIQFAVVVAVQEQPPGAVMLMDPLPPAAANA